MTRQRLILLGLLVVMIFFIVQSALGFGSSSFSHTPDSKLPSVERRLREKEQLVKQRLVSKSNLGISPQSVDVYENDQNVVPGRASANQGLQNRQGQTDDGTNVCSVCELNPFGTDCQHDFRRTWRWFPSVDPRVGHTGHCAGWDKDAAAALRAEIMAVQFPAECVDEHRMVEIVSIGFVGALSFPREQLGQAIMSPKKYSVSWVMTAPLHFVAGQPLDQCGPEAKQDQHSFGARCFFLPETNCTMYTGTYHANRVDDYDPYEVPARYAQFGVLWYHAQLFSFVWRLAPRYAALVDRVRTKLRMGGSAPPVIGMHVRHGDRCKAPDQLCFPLDHYMGWAFAMKHRYGVDRIYLATDDANVVNQTELYPDFEWLMFTDDLAERLELLHVDDAVLTQNEKQAYQANVEYKLGTWATDPKTATRNRVIMDSIVVDTQLLGECDYLIGSFSSAVLRGALQLSVALHGYTVPFVSVDRTWCSHWNRPAITVANLQTFPNEDGFMC